MPSINTIGADWLATEIEQLTDHIEFVTPTEYNEATRYLPSSVTSMPGYIRYDVNPYMREILDCFSTESPVREVNVKKGVQITYSTLLESGLLYIMANVKTLPVMYMTADKELASARIENNILPMIEQSGLRDIIRSSDAGNTRKSGKTSNHIQWAGGGYLVPFGARNADKMRSFSIAYMLKDEIDAWPYTVGKDGDPDALSDDRCSGYWERRKIFRGSTPLVAGASKIESAFLRGDQRIYRVLCTSCNYPQRLRWKTENKKTGVIGGMQWETQDGALVLESVRYACQECGYGHQEHQKTKLFSEADGAHWHPTAIAKQPHVRSYHLPALYSPVGMQPWYKCVATFLEAFDTETQRVTDQSKYQVFRNNVLAEPYKEQGAVIKLRNVSQHRRPEYTKGQIPNKYAEQHSGGKILFLTCTVDVHKRNLAVAVMGWTIDARTYIIDYQRFEVDQDSEHDDCGSIDNPVWTQRLRPLIEEKRYIADDGTEYGIALTLIDAGYQSDTVVTFCSDYQAGVYPIYGRDRPARNQAIKEFAEFTTQRGTLGFRILVDHYKDRLAPVLRREWQESERQGIYHFNAPVDLTDDEIKELTVEVKKEVRHPNGVTTYCWFRPYGSNNELWDLLVYGHCAVEILAWQICIQQFELETIEWPRFWAFIDEHQLFYKPPPLIIG